MWVLWIVIAVAALVGEMFTLALVLASFAVAALVTVGLSFVLTAPLQGATFIALSLALIFGVRPAVLPLLPRGSESRAEPRIGPIDGIAVTVDRVDLAGGQVRIGKGEFWSARPVDSTVSIPPGQEVRILAIDGLTAIVERIAPAPWHSDESTVAVDVPFGLSPRELEVLRLVADGLTNAEIADRLVLSVRTVHHHVSHIFDKMGVNSRVDAVRLGITRGIVEVGSGS